jgi:hypothetical protein
MDEYADLLYYCVPCRLPYKPKVQGGIIIVICPNCKDKAKELQLSLDTEKKSGEIGQGVRHRKA